MQISSPFSFPSFNIYSSLSNVLASFVFCFISDFVLFF